MKTRFIMALAACGYLATNLNANSVSGSGVLPISQQRFTCSDTEPLSASCTIDQRDFPGDFDAPSILGTYQATSLSGSVVAYSESNTFMGDCCFTGLSGDAEADLSASLLFTNGTGAGTAVLTVNYSAFSDSDAQGFVPGNASVSFGGFSFTDNNDGSGNSGTLDFAYSFTFGSPLDFSMSAQAHSDARGHERFISQASVSIESVRIFAPEPAYWPALLLLAGIAAFRSTRRLASRA